MNNDKMQKLTAQLMEQAQVFASSWSLVGGPFDDGSALADAEEAKAELNSMICDALSAATGGQEIQAKTAKQQYEEYMGEHVEKSPIERMRFFCSLAMNGQDWLDSEPFFDDLSTGGQESEAQEVGYVYRYEFGGEMVIGKHEPCFAHEKLPVFLAPPSALAIETAAKRQAAEVCIEMSRTIGAPGEWLGGAISCANAIGATIPQDGITELERFGMKVAKEIARHGDWTDSPDAEHEFKSIVSSLIGEK